MTDKMWIESDNLFNWCHKTTKGKGLLTTHYDALSNKFLIDKLSLNFLIIDENHNTETLACQLLSDETATRSLIKGGFAFNRVIIDSILCLSIDFLVTSKCGKKILALNNFELAKRLATKVDTSKLIERKYYPLAFAVIKGAIPLDTLPGFIKGQGPKFVDKCTDPFFSYAFNYVHLTQGKNFYRLEKNDDDYRLKLEQILLSELPNASDLFIKLVLYRTPKNMISATFINKFDINDRVNVMKKLIGHISIHNYRMLAPLSTIDSKLNIDQTSKINLETLYNEALINLAIIMIGNHLKSGYDEKIQFLLFYIDRKLGQNLEYRGSLEILADALEIKADSIKANQQKISHAIPPAKQQPSNTSNKLMFNDFSIEFIHDGQEEDGLEIQRIQSTKKEQNRPR